MKQLAWHFVTENQRSKEIADKLGQLLIRTIGLSTSSYEISRYEKFKDSYSIQLTTVFAEIEEPGKMVVQLLKLSGSICSPWTVNFNEPIEQTEMLFNKQSNSKYSIPDFDVIRWGHIQFI